MDIKALYQRTIDTWGSRAQLEMAQEEATELALAIRKLIRDNSEKRLVDMIGEIADVEIMIAQIEMMHPNFDIRTEVEKTKIRKLLRLEKRLDALSFEELSHDAINKCSVTSSTTDLRTSAEWMKTPDFKDIVIMDPDGWDRQNYNYSFNLEKISLGEFEYRLGVSTIRTPIKEMSQ